MKVVAIHQPNYLPWLGYFHKIASSDIFVFLDNVDYQYGNATSVTNRAKIKTHSGMQLLSVPVKKNKESKLISQMGVDYNQSWQRKHLAAIKLNYSKTPHFANLFPILEQLIETKYDTLSQLNIALIKGLCKFLNIQTPMVTASELAPLPDDRNKRLIEICKQLNGTCYLSGQGGKKYNNQEWFSENGLEIKYTSFVHPTYAQQFGEFIPNLSAIDSIFNTGKAF